MEPRRAVGEGDRDGVVVAVGVDAFEEVPE